MKKSILFVDDEKQILRSIQRLFIDKEYNIYVCDNAIDAMDMLDKKSVDMIITDIRMPVMNGYELLRQVKEKHPKIIRIAISGYTDRNTICKSLDRNLAKLFIFKPWENNELISIIDNIFKLEQTLENKHLWKLINDLDDLPTLPDLFTEIQNYINDDVDINKIASKIEEDQAISSRILRIANSTFAGVKTGSIKSALQYIGLKNTENIILSNSIYDSKFINRYINDLLWKHVNITNKLVLIFSEELLHKKLQETYQTCGLLHDIGIAVLLRSYKEKYFNIIKKALTNKDVSILDLEHELLGFNHQEIAGYLLNWWELPYPIVECALYHHTPLDERVINKELLCLVRLAKYFSWKLLGYEVYNNTDVDEVLDYLNITYEDCESICLEHKNNHKRGE